MDENRQRRLAKAQSKIEPYESVVSSEMVVKHVIDSKVLKELRDEFEDLKDSFEVGFNVKNLNQLSTEVKSIAPEIGDKLASFVAKLEQAITGSLPDKVTINAWNDVIKAISNIKPQVKVLKEVDVYSSYKAANSDEGSDTNKYYGFVNAQGAWFILHELGDQEKTWKYATGTGSYQQNWARRVSQTYKYFHETNL